VDGYFPAGGPGCVKAIPCNPACLEGRGTCNQVTGKCSCLPQFDGDHCEKFSKGYSGANCDKPTGTGWTADSLALIKVAGMVFSALILVASLIIAGWKLLKNQVKSKSSNTVYLPVVDLDDEAIELDSNIVNPHSQANDDEDQHQHRGIAPKPPLGSLIDVNDDS